MKFSKSQEKAYKAMGSNVLVSAGAGSGKTQVLSERVRYLVEEHNYKIDDFLILTFTNLAANEMKERIRKKLKGIKSIEADRVDNAYICTFDSFALNIIKKYHYLINISKNISLIDDVALKVYVYDLIDEILEREFSSNVSLQKLAQLFVIKDTKTLKDFIFKVYEKATGSSDTEAYLKNLIEKSSKKYIFQYVSQFEKEFYEIMEDFRENLNNYKPGPKYVTDGQALLKAYDSADTLDERFNVINNYPLPRDTFKDPEAKAEHSRIKDTISDIKNFYTSEKELYDEFDDNKEYTDFVVSVVREIIVNTDKYKEEIQCYTFSDIAKMAIDLFKRFPDVRKELKKRFKTIMIDEYQDTSQLQEDFISLIADNNIYMVGDVKQSIYRFRKAVPQLFIEKFNNYQKGIGGQLISLSDNYRSRGEVLNDINILFSKIMTDEIGGANYRRDHIISTGNSNYNNYRGDNQNYNIELFSYENPLKSKEYEIRLIAEDIIDKINNKYQIYQTDKNDNPFLRDAKFSDFCVLIDRGKDFPLYQKVFNEYGIPLFVENNVDISKKTVTSVIKNILLLTKCIIDRDFISPTFNHAFISVMRSFVYQEKDEDIFGYITNKNAEESNLIKDLKKIYQTKEFEGPYAYIVEVVNKLRIYEKLVYIGDIRMHEKYLDSFLSALKNLNNQGYNLDEFSHYFEMIVEKKMKIDVPSSSTDFDSVKLMNIHKSKGLEFSIVYIAGIKESFNRDELKSNYFISDNKGIIYPTKKHGKNIIHYLDRKDYIKEDLSEKIRLFYVQLTRAKEKIICLYPKNVKANKFEQSKKIFDLLAPGVGNFVVKETTIRDELIKAQTSNFNETKVLLNHCDIEIEDELIDIKRASKTLSFDSVKNVLEYGEKLHFYLEMLDFNNPDYSLINSSKERSLIKNFVESDLIKNLKNPRFYKEYEFIDNVNHRRGFIDLLIIDDQGAYIIDYKLKNIEDDLYVNQLQTYFDFVKTNFDLEAKCYLYSILEGNYKEIEVDKTKVDDLFHAKN